MSSGAGVGSADWDRGLRENAGWAGRFARWASSPGFSVAAPATCLVALRARIRRCRLPTDSPRVVDGEEEPSESSGAGCPSRFLRGGDRRRGPAAVGGPDRDAARGAGAVRPEPRRARLGGVGGDGQRVGDRADPRAARRAGDRRLAERHRHPTGPREDRPPRRADVGQAVVGGRARRGLDAGRAGPHDASATCAPGAAGPGALAGQERDPRGVDALPEGPAAGRGPLRRQGPALAGRAAAGGLRARDRRRRPAPGRLPRHRDRRGRAARSPPTRCPGPRSSG